MSNVAELAKNLFEAKAESERYSEEVQKLHREYVEAQKKAKILEDGYQNAYACMKDSLKRVAELEAELKKMVLG